MMISRNLFFTGLAVFGLAAISAVQFSPLVHAADDCLDGSTPCQLGDRSYHILPPDGWDGKTALPVMLYFHGWGRQGNVPVNHKFIGAATRKAGILLVAPDGLGKSWDFWRPGSRDTDFAKAVINEVEKKFPILREELYVSGYSWGSSMAWRYSCEAGDTVKVLLGISGTFYDQSENCETGPVEVRHVHGLKDTVMDYPFGPNGEETGAVRLWQRHNGCAADADRSSNWETSQKFTRYEWDDCSSGKSIKLDLHQGGHWIARGWMEKQLAELLANPVQSN